MCMNAFVPSGRQQRLAQMAIADAQNAQFAEMQRIAEQQRLAAEANEALRQQNIQSGNAAIDSAFGQFNDDFFGGIKQSFVNAQMPGLDEQYARAKDELTALLAGRGTLDSTVAADQFARLTQRRDAEAGAIGARALDFVNGLRGQVNNTRNNLLGMVTAGGDPSGIAARATGEATSLARTAAQMPSAPLGSVFGAALSGAGDALANMAGAAGGAPRVPAQGVRPTLPSGGGSMNVVR